MRTVIVTGTSSGVGLVTAAELASRGWRVFATMRNLKRAGPLLDLPNSDSGISTHQLDVTDRASIAAGVRDVLSQTSGTLDAVVHNAGVAVGAAFEDLPPEDVRRIMETNFFGVLELTRALLPTFRKQRAGRIVIMSSDAGFAGQPGNSVYCASKWALEGWAESIAYELNPFGIDVILVEPGPYATKIWENSPWINPESSAYRRWVQQLFEAAGEHVAKTARDPREVALVIAKALEARRPRFRYPVGPIAKASYLLRGKIPSRLRQSIVTRYLGLNKRQP